jgi:hypothetical protein
MLVFDIAEPGRSRGLKQLFKEGPDYACLVDYEHETSKQRLTRHIVTYRKVGDAYHRHQETHRLQLYRGSAVARVLREIGFRVRLVRGYGAYRFPKCVVGVVARKP